MVVLVLMAPLVHREIKVTWGQLDLKAFRA